MNMAVCIVAACIPCTFRSPAFLSNELVSFIRRLLRLVHAADSKEHHAVPTVASAITSAVTGSTHFFFNLLSCRFSGLVVVAPESMREETSEGRSGLFQLTGVDVMMTFSARPDKPRQFCLPPPGSWRRCSPARQRQLYLRPGRRAF